MTKKTRADGVSDPKRRDFLKLASVAGPAAAATAAIGGTAARADDLVLNETRLQDTAHTRAYYESIRF